MTNEEIEQHYISNWNKFVKMFTRRSESKENAEDIVQNAYEKALKYKNKQNIEDFDRWFFILLRNSFRDFMRVYRQREGVIFDEEEFQYPAEEKHNLRLKKEVKGFIEKKSANVKDILTLFIIQELSAKEIYETTEYSAHQIKMAIYRFREKMKKIYERGQ